MMNKMIKKKFIKPLKSIINSLPIMFGIILLLGIIEEYVSYSRIAKLFTNNIIADTFIGSAVGSVFAGNTMNSYIIGRELINANVSLFAVTAFLVSWVTVGLVQLPIEAKFFGMSFAIKRNLYSGLLSIIVSLITVVLWRTL